MTMSPQYTGLLCIFFVMDSSKKNDTYLAFLVQGGPMQALLSPKLSPSQSTEQHSNAQGT